MYKTIEITPKTQQNTCIESIKIKNDTIYRNNFYLVQKQKNGKFYYYQNEHGLWRKSCNTYVSELNWGDALKYEELNTWDNNLANDDKRNFIMLEHGMKLFKKTSIPKNNCPESLYPEEIEIDQFNFLKDSLNYSASYYTKNNCLKKYMFLSTLSRYYTLDKENNTHFIFLNYKVKWNFENNI